MAVQHEVAGPVLVTYQASPVDLGYTRDGAQIRFDPRFIDIFSDDYGGQSGAPADAQIVGATVQVTAELTKYDKAVCHALTAFSAGGTAFTLPVYGTLMRQGSKLAPLILNGANEDWTFSKAFPRSAIEMNKGTKFSTFQCGFECWVDASSTRVMCTLV